LTIYKLNQKPDKPYIAQVKENIREMGSPFGSRPDDSIEPERKHRDRTQPESFPFRRDDGFDKVAKGFKKRTWKNKNPAVSYQVIFQG